MTTTKATTTNMVRAMTKQAQPIKVRAMRPTLTMACTAMMMRSISMTTVLHWAVTQQYHEMTQSSKTTTSRQKLTTTVRLTMMSGVGTMTAATTRTMFANLLATITRVATSTTKTTLRHSKSKVLYHEVGAGTLNLIVQSTATMMSVTTRPRTRTMKMTHLTVFAARTKVADKAKTTTTTTTTVMRILGYYST